jgi:hypothetical protein
MDQAGELSAAIGSQQKVSQQSLAIPLPPHSHIADLTAPDEGPHHDRVKGPLDAAAGLHRRALWNNAAHGVEVGRKDPLHRLRCG